MSMIYDVAVVGATGLVGETVLAILQERNFPVGNIHLLASERSVGIKKQFKGKNIQVENLQDFDFFPSANCLVLCRWRRLGKIRSDRGG